MKTAHDTEIVVCVLIARGESRASHRLSQTLSEAQQRNGGNWVAKHHLKFGSYLEDNGRFDKRRYVRMPRWVAEVNGFDYEPYNPFQEGCLEETVGMCVKMAKLDPTREDLTYPEDAKHMRIIGCPDMRQCEVRYEFGTLFFRERDKDDSHFITIDLDPLWRRAWVALIKANDGMEPQDAMTAAMQVLPGYSYAENTETDVVKKDAEKERVT